MTRSLVLILLLTASLAQAAEDSALSISIGIFTYEDVTAIDSETELITEPATIDSAQISSAAIQLAESRYIPMHLRYRLESTGRFGAVRVLPLSDSGAELQITGHIEHSDAYRLALKVLVQDSSGNIWINQQYEANAVSAQSLYKNPQLDDDFQALYQQISRDITDYLDTLSSSDIDRIRNLALLRYGQELAADSFTPLLSQDANGLYDISRLPARNDPILTSVLAIRDREYLFIDVVDEEYSRFYADIKPVYDMWREFRREQTQNAENFTQRQLNEKSDFRRGSYYALQENYNNYRWAKLQELYLDELKDGFANETQPTDIELTDSIYRLTGTMEQQYREWRNILLELYQLENR